LFARALAEGIRSLLADEELAARCRAEGEFSWDTIVKRLKTVFLDVCR